ncbi:50S ribosomal protein l24 [Physcia stellaris]|nr:50S ribosomal protein l24 [Physcia stellaris]
MPPPPIPSTTFLHTFRRTLTTTTPQHAKAIPPSPQAPSPPPPYPYGASQNYKQRNLGLYGTSQIRFGNTVSTKNSIKTRRVWKPNVHSKRLWSDALSRFVRVRVQARVLRTIDKVGGLDEYLLGDTPGRIKELGPAGWALRWRLLGTERVRGRYRAERRRLGLPEEGIAAEMGVGRTGEVVRSEVLEGQYRAFDEELDEVDRRVGEEGEEEGTGVLVGDGEREWGGEGEIMEEDGGRVESRERV